MVLLLGAWPAHASEVPLEVEFSSADGRTMLRGYAFMPASGGPWPSVVMLHGRSGPYSDRANGVYGPTTLSMRHRQWGRFWAERGYLALHVDSFGPRGYPQGFPARSYSQRPAEVNEQTVRPLDAYGALAYLRSRDDVVKERIGLHGWSNGGMAGLATLDADAAWSRNAEKGGFRAALLFYPGCRIQAKKAYRPYAPAIVFAASEDKEVSPRVCRELAEQVKSRGGEDFELVWYDGADHDFDNPMTRRQAVEANRRARSDAMARAEAFFEKHLKQ
jgi:dienelactone hydrolase